MVLLTQKPWLMSTTIKDNICLNKPYDKDKLDKILEETCLDDDVKEMKGGIEKHVGEGGLY